MLGDIIGAIGNVVGGLIGSNSSEKAAQLNYQAQKEFAQQGVRWKVEDAKAAGIHPLYALGANTVSFSPSFVGDTGLASGVAAAGQNVGRAVDAMRTPAEKADAYTKTVQALSVQRMGLENELLASQIATVKQPGSPPGLPGSNYLIPGQGQAAAPLKVTVNPLERVASSPTAAHAEHGAVTDVGFLRTKTGWMPVMSQDAKQRLEEDMIGTLLWNIRNRLVPMFPKGFERPDVPLELGDVIFDPFAQEYRKRPKHWRD